MKEWEESAGRFLTNVTFNGGSEISVSSRNGEGAEKKRQEVKSSNVLVCILKEPVKLLLERVKTKLCWLHSIVSPIDGANFYILGL